MVSWKTRKAIYIQDRIQTCVVCFKLLLALQILKIASAMFTGGPSQGPESSTKPSLNPLT